ncbi:hypothetical protein ABZ805_10320 [Saccharopolyspora sp. NPDC047091]|uniref:NACHT domain-containing protein n=1 Tax=Saccharopolyspora sp. NPDC047091 TaxID=3155924 RepID=UPI003402F6D8
MVKNESHGTVNGPLVQAESINGNINFEAPRSDHRLREAMASATVPVGQGRGVVVARDLVLTCAGLVEALGGPVRRVGSALVLVRVELGDHPIACLAAGMPADEAQALLRLSDTAGAPVLNRRTGAVCGLYDGREVVEIPSVPEAAAEAGRANHAWLDLLDADQLRAGEWRHAGERLRSYLTTISGADQKHSYHFLCPRIPELSTIYVSRTAARDARREDGGDADEVELLRAEKLLQRHAGGVQIVDAPGMGKSSLVRRLAADAAHNWLERGYEEFVPLLVPAAVLSLPKPLPDALAEGFSKWFSSSLATRELVELFSEEPIPGVPWLIFADGLDEIAGLSQRDAVMTSIRKHRKSNEYRFLITSRPLRYNELGKIERPGFPTYRIEPFSDVELERFAERFLAAQGDGTNGSAADFMEHVRRTEMLALAKVPLTATMLCTLYTDQPTAELPSNQALLYREFLDWARRKRNDPVVRNKLRTSVAGGPSAAAAVDEVMDDLDDLLKHVAHLGQGGATAADRGSLLDNAVSWAGSRKPRGISDQEWKEVLSDALRQSGVLIQTSDDRFEFMHKTVEEYLAARAIADQHPAPNRRTVRKLLSTRAAWPSGRVRIFLAAHWLADEVDLSRYLRGTLRGWRRQENVGFLVESVQHGLRLDEKVRRRVEKLVLRKMHDTKTPVGAWEEAVRRLEVVNPELAVHELEGLADRSANPDEGRCLQALRELIFLAVPGVPRLAESFLVRDDTNVQARKALIEALGQHDRATAIALLSRMAECAEIKESRRVEVAARLVSISQESGMRVLVGLSEGENLTDYGRFAAVREILKVDSDLGLSKLRVLLEEVRDEGLWGRVADLLGAHDVRELRECLGVIANSSESAPGRRHSAAAMLVDRFDEGHRTLLDIVRDGRLSVPLRIKSVVRAGSCDGSLARIVLLDVLEGASLSGPMRIDALEALLRFDPGAAREGLVKLIRIDRFGPEDQLRVLKIEPGRSSEEQAELCVLVARRPGRYQVRIDAAHLAAKCDRGRARQAFSAIVEDRSIDDGDRVAAALEPIKYGSEFCGGLLEILVRDSALSETAVEKASRELWRHAPVRWRRVIFALFADSSCSRSHRVCFVRGGKSRSEAVSLLESIASKRGDDTVRLEAAHVLAELRREEEAIKAFRAIENDMRAGKRARREASAGADRLERR